MPENEKPVNIHWLVGIAGVREPLVVYAAYVTQGSLHTITQGSPPVILKDADHKVVFQGSPEHVQYVWRTGPAVEPALAPEGFDVLYVPAEVTKPRYTRQFLASDAWADVWPGFQCRLRSPGAEFGEAHIEFRVALPPGREFEAAR